MIITDLRLKTKNNPNIFIATTDSGEMILHSDIIVKNGIKLGEISSEVMTNCVRDSAEIIAFNIAVKYISNKVKTEQQIRDYLYKKEFHSSIVNAVITKLKEYGVINDEMYAESYIRSNKNFSKMKMKQKLYSFGIKKDLIEDITVELDDYDSCINNAKKYLRTKELSHETAVKLTRRLSSMGYTWDTISRVLRELRVEIEEE